MRAVCMYFLSVCLCTEWHLQALCLIWWWVEQLKTWSFIDQIHQCLLPETSNTLLKPAQHRLVGHLPFFFWMVFQWKWHPAAQVFHPMLWECATSVDPFLCWMVLLYLKHQQMAPFYPPHSLYVSCRAYSLLGSLKYSICLIYLYCAGLFYPGQFAASFQWKMFFATASIFQE